jgi:hypothetical protein
LRAIAQAGLYPSNCRILDAQEAFNTGAADGSVAIMVLGFESGDHRRMPGWHVRSNTAPTMAGHLLILCVSIPCCETSPSRNKLKHLSANLGHAAVRNPQTARSA